MQQNSDDVEPGGLMEWLVGAAFLGIALYSISSARRHRRTDSEVDAYDGNDSAVVSERASERDDECRDGSDDGRGDDDGGSCDTGDSDAGHSPD
jgi:hypothetical protein